MDLRESIQRTELIRHSQALVELAESIGLGEDFPTETAGSFCNMVAKTAKMIADNLSSAPPDKLLHIHAFLIELGQHLRYPERSRIDQTPWSVVQATEKFLQDHVGSDCNFIVRPQWNYNYSIVGEFVGTYRRHIAALKGWLDVADWELRIGAVSSQRIYCISFPRVERLNVLMHVNWGHEVGHILAGDWIAKHFGTLWRAARVSIVAEIRSKISAAGSSSKSKLQINMQVAKFEKDAKDLAESTLKELISDAIGAHLFGPAALSSLAEFSSRAFLDTDPLLCRFYPPWRYRLRLVLESVASDLSSDQCAPTNPILQRYVASCLEWSKITAQTDDQAVIDSDMRTKEVFAWICSHWSTVRRQVIAQLPTVKQEPYRFSERIDILDDLVNRIECGIPPNETGMWPNCVAASIADIWNAAWAVKISMFTNPLPVDYRERLETLTLLTLKAIEASFVQTSFASRLP